jgi:transposase
MSKERLSIMKIKDVLRLKFDVGLSNRQIGNSLGISHSTVAGYLRRTAQAGIGWPLPETLSETELEQKHGFKRRGEDARKTVSCLQACLTTRNLRLNRIPSSR